MPNVIADVKITKDDHGIIETQLTTTSLILGRGEDADIQLDHDSISRRHAELCIQGDHPILTDLNSSNGTYLNGNKIEANIPIALTVGDIVYFGMGDDELEVLRIAIAPSPERDAPSPERDAPPQTPGFSWVTSLRTEKFSPVVARIQIVGGNGVVENPSNWRVPLVGRR